MQTNQASKEGKICQECKRLKIKCSRTIPCDQCMRRGIEEICPDGKLRGGRQGRYLLASSETLHEENKALKLRIRALEQALESSSQTKAPHPLLEPHLLSIARPYLSEEVSFTEIPKTAAGDDLVNRFGTMHIDYGRDKWLGPTSLSEVHLDFHDKDDVFVPEIDDHGKFAAPFSKLFPPSFLNSMAAKNLPSKVEAWSLLETFYANATYAYNIIPREDFIQRIFTPAYAENAEPLSPYQNSTLYSVLALGALHDISRPIYSPITRDWFEIAQTLLMSNFGGWQTSLESVESVALFCYLVLARPELELSKVYYINSWALKMAQSIGLHRNPEELGLDKQTCQRRRHVFSEVCLFDASESLLYGRPFTMSNQFIAEGAKGYGDTSDQSFRFRLTLVKLMEEVAVHFMDTSGPALYSNVLRLDRKLRSSQPPLPTPADAENQIGTYLRDLMHFVWYQSTLLSLHRPYFALAATKCTAENPSGGKLSSSIFASYEAATSLVQSMIAVAGIRPGFLARLSLAWPHLSTCMALSTADTCMALVYQASTECVRAREMLPYLFGLQKKAHSSFLSQDVGDTTANLRSSEIAGLPIGVSVHSLQAADQTRGAHQNQRLDARNARSLALRHISAYFSEVGEYFGHASGLVPSGSRDMGASSDDLGIFRAFEGSFSGTYSPPVDIPIPDTASFPDHPLDSDGILSANFDQISQLQLQQSWSDFLSHL